MTRRHGRYGRSAGKIACHRRIAKPTIRTLSPDPRNYQDAISRIAAVVAGAHGAIP